jgi:hypothetical protein
MIKVIGCGWLRRWWRFDSRNNPIKILLLPVKLARDQLVLEYIYSNIHEKLPYHVLLVRLPYIIYAWGDLRADLDWLSSREITQYPPKVSSN